MGDEADAHGIFTAGRCRKKGINPAVFITADPFKTKRLQLLCQKVGKRQLAGG